MTKHLSRSLVTVLALAATAGVWACSSAESPMTDEGGEGGFDETGTGGKVAGTGGKIGGTGGKTGGGTGGESASGGSAAGGSATGGSAAGGNAAGGSAAGGSAAGGSGDGGMGDGGTGAGGSGAGGTGAGGTGAGGAGPPGKFTITVDGVMMGTRLCFKPEASNSGGPKPNAGGNKSPKIDWTTPPEGTKSLVLTMFDQSNQTPHRIVCNMMPDVTGQKADVGTYVPPGAQVSTGHNKPMNMWYGPGAGGDAHSYEIAIWALSTPMLDGGCAMSGATGTKAVYNKLKNAPPTLVLAHDAKVLWGNVDGKCTP
jgi:phosphatidylethanolamine-binding protein (PEBP) family uncharacterized protein